MKNRFVALLIALVMVLSVATVASAEEVKQFDVTALYCWSGASANFPDDMATNPAAQYVAEKFGLNFTLADNGGNQSETEYLNMMFSAGTLPDVVQAPYWSADMGGEGYVCQQGAVEGMVKNIAPYLDQFPNLKAIFETEGILSKSYTLSMIECPDYEEEGAIYFIPTGINMNSAEFASVYCDTLFAREDVLEAVGWKAEDVTDTDKLVEFLKAVRDAGLTDWNGNPMIPLGTGHDGWRNANIYNWLRGNNISNWRQLEDGSVSYYLFTDYVEGRIKLMKTLFDEGLIDLECLTQTDEVANNKLANGQYAVASVDANYIVNVVEYGQLNTLASHPEATWVPLGLKNLDGNNCVDVYQPGYSGGGELFFSAEIEEDKMLAILSFMDWLCTEEGQAFNWYGVEGVTMERDEKGRPALIESVKAEIDEDNSLKTKKFGIELFNNLACYDQRETNWAKTDDELTPQELRYRQMQNFFRPRAEVNALSVEYLLKNWEGYTDLNDAINILDAGTKIQQAYYYETWEEVEAMLADLRQKALDTGIEEAFAYIEANLTEDYAF